MSEPLRICLFNPDPQFPLHTPFGELTDLQVVGHASTWDELREELRHTELSLIAVNLDSDESLDIVKKIAVVSPGCGIIGISNQTDPTTIIKAMRSGCSQFVPWPIDVSDLQSAIEQIMTSGVIGSTPSQRICVVGSSGGAGATTLSCNLAIELASVTKRRCGLVDLNLELGDVGCAFDCEPKYSVADICCDGVEIDSLMLNKAFYDLHCNVSLLVRPEDLAQTRQVTPEGISQMLNVAAKNFPFVVVDLPRLFSFISAAALRETDLVLIVAQLGVPFIRNATRIYECLCEMGAPEDRIEIVLNRHKANYQRLTPDDVEAHFGKPVFGIIPNDYRRVQGSLDRGHPIVTDDANSPARLAIHELARRIARHEVPEDPAGIGGSRSLLGRFWKKKPIPANAEPTTNTAAE